MFPISTIKVLTLGTAVLGLAHWRFARVLRKQRDNWALPHANFVR